MALLATTTTTRPIESEFRQPSRQFRLKKRQTSAAPRSPLSLHKENNDGEDEEEGETGMAEKNRTKHAERLMIVVKRITKKSQ